MDLALNNLRRLTSHKNPTNQPIKLTEPEYTARAFESAKKSMEPLCVQNKQCIRERR